MEAQTPAEGILLHRAYGDVRLYTVPCDCGCDSEHQICVEADDCGVSVTTCTTQKTNWWTESVEKRYDIDNNLAQWYDWFWKDIWNGLVTRLRLTRDIWFHGYVKYEATLIMSKQQATNYGHTLLSAVEDVEAFRRETTGTKI
jgi:hypothetical protein